MKEIKKTDIEKAYEFIKGQAHKTPILTSRSINEITNADLYFKCENFQRGGAFKFRGAYYTISQLEESNAKFGVATHSSGNHAQAVALAAKLRGIKAYIVMPENAPKVKVNAVKEYGGKITFCKPTQEARLETLKKIIEETNSVLVHPYNNENVIQGQGTASLEFLDEIPDLDSIVTPIGGGGLLAGTSIYAKEYNKSIKVYGAEPSGADDSKRSFDAGKIIPIENPDTICDGLLTTIGEIPFEYIKDNVDDILLADDDSIKNAMQLVWERMKIVIEPSAATTLAVVLNYKELFAGKKIGLILSGGNVDFNL